ncbi:hypothetical protein [Nocardia farcinica]|uniref:PD-(D/E)XK nuclease domain-containing protein n=2 Tax=Nocardia farcinica TaxID=37329 RepID=UPI0022BA1109|nr:hypothetical protein [Nocardia farcinica]MCZ9328787.1 hypothetical protein [Nocardia farcinica]
MTTSGGHNPSGVTGQLLGTRIANLEDIVQRANLPGNLDGLLAHHILGDRYGTIVWNVNPMTPEWLADNKDRLVFAAGLAILGYGLTGFSSIESTTGRQHLKDGLPNLMRRNPFEADGVTFVNDPSQVVGIVLAVNAVYEDLPEARAWLAGVLHDPHLSPATPLLGIFQQRARQIIEAPGDDNPHFRTISDPVELAGWHWLATHPESRILKDAEELQDVRSRLVSGLILSEAESASATRAALLLDAVSRIVTTSVYDFVLSTNHVGVLLGRFSDAMRQWRHDGDNLTNPIRWPITQEREVQNILWLILRPVFDNLIDEETLRKFGHSTYRADFAIPSLGLLIEVKYARRASDFKDFEKEIAEDYVAYLTDNHPYKKLAVFIYDESCSVQEHGTTRNALIKLPHITDVVIASRPSHIPAPPRTRRE